MEIKILAQKFYDYSIYIKNYSKETVRRYRYVIDFYCKFANISLITEVTQDNMKNLFYYGRAERSWSANTAVVFYKSLTVFFRWCMAEGYVNFNPMTGIHKPQIEQKLPKKLTKQDAMKLLEIVYHYPYTHRFLRYRNYAIFAMFVYAGLRKQELLNLKYANVDLDNLSIFINHGKGAKDRFVPISQTLAISLRQYVKERDRLNKTCPEFFTSLQRNRGFTVNGLKHFIDKIRPKCGVEFTPHKLRHTFATLMLEGGCDIYSLSRMMGHRDIKTTTIYLYASAEHLKSQILKHPLNN